MFSKEGNYKHKGMNKFIFFPFQTELSRPAGCTAHPQTGDQWLRHTSDE